MRITAILALVFFLAAGYAAEEKVIMKGFADSGLFALNRNFGRVSADGGTLIVDCGKSGNTWNWVFRTNPGVLKPDTNYLATFRYRVTEPDMTAKYFHFLCRPFDAGDASLDTVRHDEGDSAVFKPVRIHFSTRNGVKDYAFQIHAHQQLQGEITDFVLTELAGNREELIPIAADGKAFTGELGKLPTGAEEFEVELPRNPGGVAVDASLFGVSTENPDNVPGLNRALEHCRKNGVARLTLKKGVYRMTSNTAVLLEDMRDFELDGSGSTLVYHKEREPNIRVKNCERVRVRNLNFDWDWEKDPLASIVQVVRADAGSADFRFIDYKRFPRRDLRVAIVSSYDPVAKAVGFEGGFDQGFEFFAGKTKPVTEWLDANTLKITGGNMGRFAPGQLFRMQHYYYDMNCFVMEGNRHLSIEDVNIYSNPGHAFTVSGTQQYWQFLRVRIAPPAGVARRPITCTADHCHISKSRGFFKMVDCEFSYGADDCLNAHDNSGFAKKMSEYSLKTRNVNKWNFGIGDPVELRHGDYSPSGFQGELKSVRAIDESAGVYEFTFDKPVPEPIEAGEGFVMFNRKYGTRNVIVRNCYFHSNRARGILILASDVTIENNRFVHNEMGAIKIETGYTFNVWSEGYGADNILVRNNVFDTVNPRDVGNDGMARDIYIGVYMKRDPSTERTVYPILSNILFENNTFKDSFGLIAFISSAGNVTFRNNTFENPTARKKPLPFRAGFYVTSASNVRIVNNRYTASPHVPAPGVRYTPETVKNLVVEGNRVIGK